MDILFLLKCAVLALLLLIPIFWMTSQKFRYVSKMTAYYFSILATSTLCTIAFLFRPRDPNNMTWVCWAAQVLSSWLTIHWEIRGTEHLQLDSPAVLVCNHQSSLDCQGMGYVWPSRCVVMAKKSLLYVPFFGWAAWLSSTVFVDRFNAADARASLASAVEDIQKRKLKLWIFPEGTRNHGEGFLPFKKGAFHIAVQAQIPIIPVVFSSMSPFYSKTEKRLDGNGYVIAQVLPAVPTVGLTADDVTALCDRVREQMVDVYDVISPEARRKYEEAKPACT